MPIRRDLKPYCTLYVIFLQPDFFTSGCPVPYQLGDTEGLSLAAQAVRHANDETDYFTSLSLPRSSPAVVMPSLLCKNPSGT